MTIPKETALRTRERERERETSFASFLSFFFFCRLYKTYSFPTQKFLNLQDLLSKSRSTEPKRRWEEERESILCLKKRLITEAKEEKELGAVRTSEILPKTWFKCFYFP
jgi:hypothetical protein